METKTTNRLNRNLSIKVLNKTTSVNEEVRGDVWVHYEIAEGKRVVANGYQSFQRDVEKGVLAEVFPQLVHKPNLYNQPVMIQIIYGYVEAALDGKPSTNKVTITQFQLESLGVLRDLTLEDFREFNQTLTNENIQKCVQGKLPETLSQWNGLLDKLDDEDVLVIDPRFIELFNR